MNSETHLGGAGRTRFTVGIRAWLAEQQPPGLGGADPRATRRRTVAALWREPDATLYREWERRLLAARLICPGWPTEYGGRGWTDAQNAVFTQECLRAGLPRPHRGAGELVVGPLTIRHGSTRLTQQALPAILDGSMRVALAMSEPDSGSDADGVQTTITFSGDRAVITGMKSWVPDLTSSTHLAVTCRAPDGVGSTLAGTYVALVHKENPGLAIEPFTTMDGTTGASRVTFDRVDATRDDVIGPINDLAQWLLAAEIDLARWVMEDHDLSADLAELVITLTKLGKETEPFVRSRLGELTSTTAVARSYLERQIGMSAPARRWLAGVTTVIRAQTRASVARHAADLLGADQLAGPQPSPFTAGLLASPGWQLSPRPRELVLDRLAEQPLGLPTVDRPAGDHRPELTTTQGSLDGPDVHA